MRPHTHPDQYLRQCRIDRIPTNHLSEQGPYIRRLKRSSLPYTSLAVDTIAMSKEKGHETSSIASGSQPYVELYDPSKESVWTRVGVTWESFKRAPGTTGYGLPMISLGTRFQF